MTPERQPLRTAPPPRDPKGKREGFTTGACAAAAAKAAARVLVRDALLTSIETTLPNGQRHTFELERCERLGAAAVCSVVKDAGDDPDCTHGAEIIAEVTLRASPGIELRRGDGVACVTKPGLGLEVGAPAINPVPRRNITEMVTEEIAQSPYPGAVVTLSVPGGEEMAKQTINERLGLLGGISILGTTGIVKPYSTAAFRASVVQAIDVAAQQGLDEVVLTTGGKSEQFAMKLYPHLPEDAFIQVGDFIGDGLKRCARCGIARATIVGMMGKLSKMADGKMMTHAAGSQVNMELLASSPRSWARLRARHGDPRREHRPPCPGARARGGLRRFVGHLRARRRAPRAARGRAIAVHVVLVDFDGTPCSARFPQRPGGTMSTSGEREHAPNDMRQMTALGRSIEDGSFAIIDQEAGAHGFAADEWQVVRRIIHATADFEFKTLLRSETARSPDGHSRAARWVPGGGRRQDDLGRAQ